jgi:hypothetical protein
MFDFLKSLFGSEKETEKSVEFVETNNIIPNILAKKGLQYSNIQSGYQIKLKDGYYLVIPFIIDKNTYFYLQKGLKDKDDNEIKCTYFFKIIEKNDASDIIFVNRIKILNDNIKCDENYSRISKDILLEISNVVNEIVNNIPKKIHINRKIVETDDENNKNFINNEVGAAKSNSTLPFILGAATAAVGTGLLISSDINLMKGGNIDDKIDKKKYDTLKKLLEESISE